MRRASPLALALLLCAGVAIAANIDQLIQILKTEKSFKLRANAARLLGKSGEARAAQPLCDALKDEHPVVRATACVALAALDDPKVMGDIEKAVEDPDESVRKACKSALKQLTRPRTSQATGKRPALDLQEIRGTGAKDADGMHAALKKALKAEFESGKNLLSVEDNPARGYRLVGGVHCEDQNRGKDTILFCKANLVVARMPGKSILGNIGATGGASVSNPKNMRDREATQDALFAAFAKSLAEDLISVINTDRAQNGEEMLK